MITMFKHGRMVWGLPLVMLLAGCIGGSGSDGTPIGGGDGGTGAGVASVSMIATSPQIGTTPASQTAITAIVKDGANRAVDGQTVVFSSTSGLLVVNQGATDNSGLATATLSPGADAGNRDITVTAQAGGITSTYLVKATGSTVGITGPSSVVFGSSATLSINVKDSGGQGVPFVPVTVSSANGNQLSPSTATTNVNGVATVSFTGSQGSSGEDTVTATALGTTDSHTISVSSDDFSVTAASSVLINVCTPVNVAWSTGGAPVANTAVSLNSTRGTLYTNSNCATAGNQVTTNGAGNATAYLRSPNAGPATVTASGPGFVPSASASLEFVAVTPSSLVLQASRTKLNLNDSVTLTATVRDAAYNLVKGATVQFSIQTDTTSGSLDADSGVTDSLGRVSTVYNSTSQPSSLNGVTIRASIPGTGISEIIVLTVGDSSLSINLGMATRIESPNTATYRYPGAVQVSDSAGNPVAGARVTLKLDAESYDKGFRIDTMAFSTVSDDSTFSTFITNGFLSCMNEDGNRNGILDAGEDFNGDGLLQPGIPATVTPLVTTDEFGNAAFDVVYPKDYANWIQVKLIATAEVSGTESTSAIRFIPPMSQEDEQSPPGSTSPFGTATSCNNPN
jgi:hypothetical protein